MKRWILLAITCSVLTGLFGACGEASDRPGPEVVTESDELADTEPVALGELQYTLYCASCHGAGGKGDGPVAEALKVRPTNLTLLQSINEGEFPADRIAAYIDGREYVAAHGSREMPVWGNLWHQGDTGETLSSEDVDRRIGELVEYIRSIQE